MNNLATPEDAETFLLLHGENIVDTLGAEIDRIEQRLKVSAGKQQLIELKLIEMKLMIELKLIKIDLNEIDRN